MGRSRWINLVVFSFAAALSQALWLNFAPLILEIENKFAVSEDTAGLLLLVFPLIYVLISIPVGKFIDNRGFRSGLLVGTAIMTAGAAVRIYDGSFYVLLLAQAVIAFAQPFIINSITKLVMDCFPKEQEAIATGLGTMGMFIGMAVGLMATPMIFGAAGYQQTMIIFFVLAALSFACSLFFLKEQSHRGEVAHSSIRADLRSFMASRNVLIMFSLSFLGLGFFNGITTWLEPILAPVGITSVQAGLVGGALILGGIVGAAVVPALSDFIRRRKPVVIIGLILTTSTLLPLCSSGSFETHLFWGALQGFCFLPGFSLVLQMCSEQVGEKQAGTATGILMLLGNAGGVVVILAMQFMKSDTSGFRPSIYLLLALLIVSTIQAVFLKETHPSRL
jgi:predicted MFS family arabinose efflux permease